MSKLEYIPFEDDIKERVENYWTKRAESFFSLRQDEIESSKADRWLREISKLLPEGDSLNILDVGCGTGYFEVILGRANHRVTGIDLTQEMIEGAKEMLRIYGLDDSVVKVQQGDAEHLDFPDESFDVVISRNLTWTLPHPIKAYEEWKRVLKKGGTLINFDAEYAKGAHSLPQSENLAHKSISNVLQEECHRIYHMLTISMLDRPDWDAEVLSKLGFKDIQIDRAFADRIFIEHDEFYIPDKMFSLRAKKG